MGSITTSLIRRVAVILASALAFKFSIRGTHRIAHSFSFPKRPSTRVRQRAMRSSLASYSLWICLTINWESLHISNLIATKVRARSNPTKTASYSTSLLEARKPSRIAYSSNSPIGDYKIRPTPELEALDALPTWYPPSFSKGLIQVRWFLGEFNYKVDHNLSF